MGNNRIIFICLLLLLVLPMALLAEGVAPLKDIMLSVEVKYDIKTGLYAYRYEVINPRSNMMGIEDMSIDISQPENGKQLSQEGLVIYEGLNWKGVMMKTSFKNELSKRGSTFEISVIPVGLTPPEGNWGSGITRYGKALWGSRKEGSAIKPGESMKGFEIVTQGIPTLRDITVSPDYIAGEEDILQTGVSKEELINNFDELLEEFYQSIEYHGKTIGPTAPPAELVPLDFLENLISMKHEAVSLGWITNKGIETGLDQKLEAVKNKLRQGNNGGAKNVLKAFINEVEAQGCQSYDDCPKGKHLTPEAYALLKYNARYLADNLK